MKSKTFSELCDLALSVKNQSLDLLDYKISDVHFVVNKQIEKVELLKKRGVNLKFSHEANMSKRLLIDICENLDYAMQEL